MFNIVLILLYLRNVWSGSSRRRLISISSKMGSFGLQKQLNLKIEKLKIKMNESVSKA